MDAGRGNSLFAAPPGSTASLWLSVSGWGILVFWRFLLSSIDS